MGNVTTVKDNLFNAPKGSIIIHACNTKGVWGSGIAKEFAKRFPKAYEMYNIKCQVDGSSLLGKCVLIPAGDYVIGCLFTSKNYGQFVDKPAKILESTKLAVEDLIIKNVDKKPMHICKINSGLFRVPWNDTKKILKDANADFVVYDY